MAYSGPLQDLDLGICADEKAEIIHGMPTQLTATSSAFNSSMSDIDSEGSRYLVTSLCTEFDIRTVPAKLLASDVSNDPVLKDHIQRHSRGLQNYYPVRMNEDNPGSNAGLAKIMQRQFEEMGAHVGECDEYKVIVADINIYHRILKVYTHAHNDIQFRRPPHYIVKHFPQMMYSPCGSGAFMRKYMVLQLGLWHSYKMAHELLYRHFALELFAPLFHSQIPSSEFRPKTRLVHMERTFTCLRLAWHNCSDYFKECMESKRTAPHQKDVLQNIKDLCNFFIPAVCCAK